VAVDQHPLQTRDLVENFSEDRLSAFTHSFLLASTPLRRPTTRIGSDRTGSSTATAGHRPLSIETALVGPVKHTGFLTCSGPAAPPARMRRRGTR